MMALRENRTLGLATNSDLVRRDGFQTPIEDSAAPIHGRDGEILGSVMVFHDISESRAMALKMSHLAQHDYLTDLPNRVLLQDRFAQAIGRAKREHGHLALLYSDLDGFKHINDSLGHEVGDMLLQQVAQRLLHSVRSVDTVSRQGGDEFVILLPEIRSSSDAVRVADHILQAMRDPFQVADTELNVTLSIGIAMYPSDGNDPGVLLKYADAAMYQAKHHGRNQYRFYTRAISERADRRLSIESSLHQALRNDEFVLHYQPKVEPATGEITGMEALVRWQPPNGELSYPDDFIEIAEEERLDLAHRPVGSRRSLSTEPRMATRRTPTACLSPSIFRPRMPTPSAIRKSWPDPETHRAGPGLPPYRDHRKPDAARYRALRHADPRDQGGWRQGRHRRFRHRLFQPQLPVPLPFDVLKIDRTFVQSLDFDSKEIAIVEAITRTGSHARLRGGRRGCGDRSPKRRSCKPMVARKCRGLPVQPTGAGRTIRSAAARAQIVPAGQEQLAT